VRSYEETEWDEIGIERIRVRESVPGRNEDPWSEDCWRWRLGTKYRGFVDGKSDFENMLKERKKKEGKIKE
jgi:hypothetical protein